MLNLADPELTDHSFRLCQQLLRIDTTNPPGNEREAADLVAEELSAAGLEPVILESAPKRANVISRLKGTGKKPPLLLTAHLDVVPAEPEHWEHPPFCGEVHDQCLWGRGAIDMKHMAAMSIAILCRFAREGLKPERDVIFAAVADEEAGSHRGSLWLCANHPELVRSEYAIGEVGGFNIRLGGRSFFTVEVAEKGLCWVRARATGEPGHGSMPRNDSAVVRLSEAIVRLGKQGLPTHRSEPVVSLMSAIAAEFPAAIRPLVNLLTNHRIAPRVLEKLADRSTARAMSALYANTATPTVLRAGQKINVIPGSAEVEIDGRTLPGQTQDDFLRELRAVLGPDIELDVLDARPPVVTEPVESPLFRTIQQVMSEREPESPLVPFVVVGFTDAFAFTRLGARWYGFAPVKLPPGMRFADMFHGHNERIPVDGLAWGTEVLDDVVRRFVT